MGIEETVKYVFADGIATANPALHVTSATPVTAGCRMIKDAHELALMRLANQVTLKVYEAVYHALQPGMTQDDAERPDQPRPTAASGFAAMPRCRSASTAHCRTDRRRRRPSAKAPSS